MIGKKGGILIFRIANNIPKKCLIGSVDFIALPLSEPVLVSIFAGYDRLASEAGGCLRLYYPSAWAEN